MELDSISDVLPGLLPSFYRGIPFDIADTTSEMGRRVVEYLFPGIDPAAYDDFGLAPNVISITGLIVGDDYQARALALQSAFERAGPGLLIHPWLGPMQVILEQPAQISFSARELRVARVSASLKRVQTGGASFVGGLLGLTLSPFLDAASCLIVAVGSLVLSSARNKAATRSARILSETLTSIPRPQVRQLYADLTTAGAKPATSPAEFSANLASLTGIIASPSIAPAVSSIIEQAGIPADVGMSVALAIGKSLGSAVSSGPSVADQALLLAASSRFLGTAIGQSSYVDFASRKEAFAYRTQMIDALDQIMEAAEPLSATVVRSAAGALALQAHQLQAGVVADINEIIGRLPAALQFPTDRPVDAWLLANHVYGDNPGRVEAAYLDIVTRNRPRNPAALEPPVIEVAR